MTDYGSHRPVLAACARIWTVKRVVEFGCGEHSTSLFLDRDVFPRIERLIGFESDSVWAERVRALHGADGRFEIVVCDERDAMLHPVPAEGVDLVLVDGASAEYRVPTAEYAASIAPVVVLHDAENRQYRRAYNYYDACYTYQKAIPWTAVLVRASEADRLADLLSILEGGRHG